VSINEEIVHGIPGKRRLKEGDVVSLDVGVLQGGFYGDTAMSSAVGEVDEAGKRLMETTEGALYAGIAFAKAGNHVSDISHAIQSYVEKAGCSVVKEFVGHGIGREMHEEPQIPNYGQAGHGMELKNGHILAIEPMVNEGTATVRVLGDGWTAVTGDGKRSAHFEHTVLVTYGAPEILTLSRREVRS
jgi:methionyl aminopeptidase